MKGLLGLGECHPFKTIRVIGQRVLCLRPGWGSLEDVRPVAHGPPPPQALCVPLLSLGFGNTCKS